MRESSSQDSGTRCRSSLLSHKSTSSWSYPEEPSGASLNPSIPPPKCGRRCCLTESERQSVFRLANTNYLYYFLLPTNKDMITIKSINNIMGLQSSDQAILDTAAFLLSSKYNAIIKHAYTVEVTKQRYNKSSESTKVR